VQALERAGSGRVRGRPTLVSARCRGRRGQQRRRGCGGRVAADRLVL